MTLILTASSAVSAQRSVSTNDTAKRGVKVSEEVASAPQALVLTEDFAYTAGTALTANGWTAHSAGGTNPITVTSPGLTYPGYLGSGIGNAATLTTSGEDDNRTLTTPVTTGTVYMAAMVNVTSAQANGDYFLHLMQSSTIFYGRVFVKKDPNSSNYAFGIVKTSPGLVVYEPTFSRAPGTTYLVVVKYTFNGGTATDDTVDLFINPVLGAVEPAPTLTADNTTTPLADATTFISVGLRQGAAASAAAVTVDGIRVGSTWADVTTLATAAGVTISGRVMSGDRGIRNAAVTIAGGDLSGPMTVLSGPRGQFTFNDIPAGRSYVVSVAARRFQFSTNSQIIEVNDNISDLNFYSTDAR